jgi:hypothetical protein
MIQTASFLREDPYDAMNDALFSFLDNLARTTSRLRRVLSAPW